MSKPNLPPLPDPLIVSYQVDSTMRRTELRTYDDADMYAYAEEAVRQALENAAAIADRQHFGGGHDDEPSWTDCAALIAAEIRALIPETRDG